LERASEKLLQENVLSDAFKYLTSFLKTNSKNSATAFFLSNGVREIIHKISRVFLRAGENIQSSSRFLPANRFVFALKNVTFQVTFAGKI
jgi:hypothetical protein